MEPPAAGVILLRVTAWTSLPRFWSAVRWRWVRYGCGRSLTDAMLLLVVTRVLWYALARDDWRGSLDNSNMAMLLYYSY